MKVEKFWSASKFTSPDSVSFTPTALQKLAPMLPETIQFQTPIVSVSIKPTLHYGVLIGVKAGSTQTIYEN